MQQVAAAGLLSLLIVATPVTAAGQSALERTAALPQVWAGVPWSLELGLGSLLGRSADGTAAGLTAEPSLRTSLALPAHLVAELRYSPQPRETGGRDELEGALRARLMGEDRGHPLDLAIEGRIATGSEMARASLNAARWIGPVRIAAAAGAMADDDRVRPLAGAGAVWHPAPGRLPIALAADAAAPLRLDDGESVAWSAALQLGIAFTPHTLSFFGTNAGTSLPGRATGTDQVRFGVKLTGQLPVGRFLGRYADRETARDAVREELDAVPVAIVPIREYRYTPARIEIAAGTAVEWVNYDQVVHTATADNNAWSSGGLQQGESWRAVFTEPGTYPYHCGPHPYMRGVVVVR